MTYKTLPQLKIQYQLKLKVAEMVLEGRSLREISEVLKISRGRAKNLYLQAKLDYYFSKDVNKLYELRVFKWAQLNQLRKRLWGLIEQFPDDSDLNFKCLETLFKISKVEIDLFGINLINPVMVYAPNDEVSKPHIPEKLKESLKVPLVLKQQEVVPIGDHSSSN